MFNSLMQAVGCTSKPGGPPQGGRHHVYSCQYCRRQFPSYEQADAHERSECRSRPGAGSSSRGAPGGGRRDYVPGQKPGGGGGQPIHIRCGQCLNVFGAPPGHAQCKCPHCNTVNAVPRPDVAPQAHSSKPQPSIPTNVYNQGVGLHKAQVGTPGPAPSGRKKALLIGCNYPGTRAELRGCVNDVNRMRQVLCGMYGFPGGPDRMRVLTDDQMNPQVRPTRANILNGLRWLSQGAQPGDVLFLHFSGHGAQQEDPNCREEDGYDETICPCDFERAGMIVDDEIYDLAVAQLPSGVKLTAVMDCCHSGTGLDLPFTWEYGRWQEEDNPCHSAGDVVLISGCQDDQTSSDGGGGYGRPAGAMTTALCNTLERHSGLLTHTQLLDGLRAELRRGGFDQVPSLTSSQAFDARQKPFSPVDYIDGNNNPELGRHFRKKKHPKRKNLLGGGLGDMLMAGAAGFLIADLAGDVLPGLAMGAMAGGDMLGDGLAAAAGGGMLGGLFGGGGGLMSDLLGGGGGDFFGGDGDGGDGDW